MDPCSESDEFRPTKLILNVHISIFLTEFDENKITMHIFYDLNDRFVRKKNNLKD